MLSDPLFGCAPDVRPNQQAFGQMMGMQGWRLDRQHVAHAAGFMRSLRYAVSLGYVRFKVEEADLADREIPFLASDDLFASAVPDTVRDRYMAAAQVQGVLRDDIYLRFEELTPQHREIAITYGVDREDGRSGSFFGYAYLKEIASGRHADGTALIKTVPSQPGEAFDTWVRQSIHLSAASHFSELEDRVHRAMTAGCGFLLESKFEGQILASQRPATIETFAGDCVVNTEVPFFNGVPLDMILHVRSQDGEAFANFRSHLQGKLRDIRSESDPLRAQQRAEDAMHELAEVERTQLSRQMQSLKRRALAEGAILMASLGASIASPWTLAGSLASAVAAAKRANDYYGNYRDLANAPSYFAWQVKKKAP